jgi:hypothetical protein
MLTLTKRDPENKKDLCVFDDETGDVYDARHSRGGPCEIISLLQNQSRGGVTERW